MYTIDECQNDINLLKGVIKGLKALPDQVNQSNLPEVKLSIHEICTNIKSMSSQEGSLKLKTEGVIRWCAFEELNRILIDPVDPTYDEFITDQLLREFKSLVRAFNYLKTQLNELKENLSALEKYRDEVDSDPEGKLDTTLAELERVINYAKSLEKIEDDSEVKIAFLGYTEKRIRLKDKKTPEIKSSGIISLDQHDSPFSISNKLWFKEAAKKEKKEDRKKYIFDELTKKEISEDLTLDKKMLKSEKYKLEQSCNRFLSGLKLQITEKQLKSLLLDIFYDKAENDFKSKSFHAVDIYRLFETAYLKRQLPEIEAILRVKYHFENPDEDERDLLFDAIADTAEIDKKSKRLADYGVKPWRISRNPIIHAVDTEKAFLEYKCIQSKPDTKGLETDFNEHLELATNFNQNFSFFMNASHDQVHFQLKCQHLGDISSALNGKLSDLYRDQEETRWRLNSIIEIILVCIRKLENLIKTTEQSAVVDEIKVKGRFYRQLILPIKQIGQLVRQLPNSFETGDKLYERKYLNAKKMSQEDYTLFKNFTDAPEQQSLPNNYGNLLFFNDKIKSIRGKLAHGKPVQVEDLEASCQSFVRSGPDLYSRLQEHVKSNSNSNSNTTTTTATQTAQPAQGFSN